MNSPGGGGVTVVAGKWVQTEERVGARDCRREIGRGYEIPVVKLCPDADFVVDAFVDSFRAPGHDADVNGHLRC